MKRIVGIGALLAVLAAVARVIMGPAETPRTKRSQSRQLLRPLLIGPVVDPPDTPHHRPGRWS